MKRLIIIACVAAGAMHAQTGWKASVAMMAAANTADILSSRGKYESNHLLTNRDGKFSVARGLIFKASLNAPIITAEHYTIKAHPRTAKWVTIANLVCVGLVARTVRANVQIRKAK